MEWDNGSALRLWVNVDTVTAFAAVELKTSFLKNSNDLLGGQRWDSRHAFPR